jgi:hypothetical protein
MPLRGVVVVVLFLGCGGVGAGGSVVASSTCVSGQQWVGGTRESSEMEPGLACISCHSSGEGPRFTIAGTVYGALKEADTCFGTSAVQVQITDAANQVITLTPNAAGNFSSSRALTLPYTAKLILPGGGERPMGGAQQSGDCNSCHTAAGAQGAPGRVLAL